MFYDVIGCLNKGRELFGHLTSFSVLAASVGGEKKYKGSSRILSASWMDINSSYILIKDAVVNDMILFGTFIAFNMFLFVLCHRLLIRD